MAFSDILGQKYAVGILKRVLETRNISHAYLFYGPENVGKTTCALAFAKALNCQDASQEFEACERCLSCQKINSGNHPDVRLIRPTRKIGQGATERLTTFEGTEIRIEQIRDLKREAMFKPYEGEWKVYIMDEADKMNSEAQNATLKLLEEPPPFVVLILVTSNREPLLPTVLSRCQPVRFNLVPIALIRERLKRQREISEEEVKFLSSLSGGRIGWAIRMSENKNLLRVRGKLFGLLRRLPQAKKVEVFRMVEELKGLARELVEMPKGDELEGADLRGFIRDKIIRNRICEVLDLMGTWYRDLSALQNSKEPDLVINQDHQKILISLSKFYPSESLKDMINYIAQTKRYIQRNANIQLALEVLVLKLMSKGYNLES